jgi:hypothetical protein
MEPTPDVVEFFTENWMHPRLAEWGRENGFVSSITPGITLGSRVGHYDHAPYALSSSYGRTVHPTPFQTSRHGRVFMVEWDRRAKAHEIAIQVQHEAKEFAKDFEVQSRLRAGVFPPRNMGDYSLSYEILREISDVKDGFTVGRECVNSLGYGMNLLDAAKTAMAKLCGGGFVQRIQSAKGFSEESKTRMIKALERLHELAPVLNESRNSWKAEHRRRDQWMVALGTRLAAEESNQATA